MYDFEITHIKGKENNIVDALSIKLNQICATSTTSLETNWIDQVKITTN